MREYIVLVSKEHYNPVGIARTLGEAGIKPVAVVVKGDLKMIAKSKYVKKTYYVDTTEEGIQLIIEKYAKNKSEKSFILTGDDVSVAALNNHYNELTDFFYFYNAGEQGRLNHFMNKDAMCKLAKKHGFNIPETWKVRTGEIPENVSFPVMTKAINSFGTEWKDIVFICNNEKELLSAYSKINSKTILLQKYVKKTDEQSYEGFCVNHGKEVFFTVQNNEVYHIPDKYSPYWINKNVDDKEFEDKARSFLADLGFEGIFEFEFMVGEDGELYFLEMNPRNTANGWTMTVAGMPSATLWCKSMCEGRIVEGCYKRLPEGFTSMAECFDYDVRVKTGIISKREWLKQYINVDAKYYLGRKDPKPFFAFMWYKFKKMRKH